MQRDNRVHLVLFLNSKFCLNFRKKKREMQDQAHLICLLPRTLLTTSHCPPNKNLSLCWGGCVFSKRSFITVCSNQRSALEAGSHRLPWLAGIARPPSYHWHRWKNIWRHRRKRCGRRWGGWLVWSKNSSASKRHSQITNTDLCVGGSYFKKMTKGRKLIFVYRIEENLWLGCELFLRNLLILTTPSLAGKSWENEVPSSAP